MKKYKCKLTDQEILEICTNGRKLFNTFIDDNEQTTIDMNKLISNFILYIK